MREPYAGIIRTPDRWVLSTSKEIYDAFDLPDGPLRDVILSAAEDTGVLIDLGPASMTGEEVTAAALRRFGTETVPGDPRLSPLATRLNALKNQDGE